MVDTVAPTRDVTGKPLPPEANLLLLLLIIITIMIMMIIVVILLIAMSNNELGHDKTIRHRRRALAA